MTSETFFKFLSFCEENNMSWLKDHGILLQDNNTYLIHECVFNKYKPDFLKEYKDHRILILTDGADVVGGVLFYGRYDIQIDMFPDERGCGYMSEIHKNGVLNDNMYSNQEVSIDASMVKDQDDLNMKLYLLGFLDVKIKNLDEISHWYSVSKACRKNIPGIYY